VSRLRLFQKIDSGGEDIVLHLLADLMGELLPLARRAEAADHVERETAKTRIRALKSYEQNA